MALPKHTLSSKGRWTLPAPLIAIADEHRYVLRLINILESETAILAEGEPADFDCMADILNYITHYPDKVHHPKEELIFDKMDTADKNIQKIIKKLRQDHGRVSVMGQEITEGITDIRDSRSKKKRKELAVKIDNYITRLRAHVKLEETQIFEPAATLLSAADWKAIDKKIKPIIDPIFGYKQRKEFVPLFKRYLSHAATVSTGRVSPKLVEKAASSIERMIYAASEVRQLPVRILSTLKDDTKEQFILLRALGAARDFSAIKKTLSNAREIRRANADMYMSMIKDAFLAQEPADEECEASTSPTVLLKEDRDFIAYKESHPNQQDNVQISWQALATNVLFRVTIKQLMAHMGLDSVEHAKKLSTYMNGIPDGIKAEEVKFEGFRARWLRPKGQTATTKTLLYLPGGGFVFPASSGHTKIVASLVKKMKAQGLLVHYRLAPEHPFPAGLEDAISAYKHLLNKGIPASDIVIAGDSAGGGLTLSLLLAIKDEKLPMPRAVTVICPLADLSFSGDSREFNRWRDPMLPTSRKMKAFEEYTGGVDPEFPLLSPVYGNMSGFPPMFAQVGSTEILLDDTLRVAQRARAAGVEVEVEVWNALPHVWHLWSYMPESDRALTRIAEFFNTQYKSPVLKLVDNKSIKK